MVSPDTKIVHLRRRTPENINQMSFFGLVFYLYREEIAVSSKGGSTCGQRDMKWAPLRHISDLELQEMIEKSSGTLIAFT